jgi:hypothetical protein
MNTNESNRFTNGVQPNFEWQSATQQDANHGNFRTGFGVKQHYMNVPPIPNPPSSPSRVRNIRCAAPQAPAWEYKIGIALADSSAARKEAQEFFSKAWGRRGWIFVTEKQGIFHFKRVKR